VITGATGLLERLHRTGGTPRVVVGDMLGIDAADSTGGAR
jgi:hypothetical protein